MHDKCPHKIQKRLPVCASVISTKDKISRSVIRGWIVNTVQSQYLFTKCPITPMIFKMAAFTLDAFADFL